MELNATNSECRECGGTGRKLLGPEHWVLCPACAGQTDSAEEVKATPRNPWAFRLFAVYLIGSLLYRSLVTAHEYPMRGALMMRMIFDLLCIVALIGLRPRDARGGGRPLFWLGLVAGIGLFAIRLTGDSSWWTGHLKYDWRTAPRDGASSR